MISCDRLIQVDRLGTQARHLPLGAREVQDVLDEVHQPAAFLDDHAGRGATLVVGAHAAEVERLGEEHDLRERRAQLVRDAGDEIRAQPRQLVLAPKLEHRQQHHRRRQREESDEDRHPRLGERAEREQLDGARPNRRVNGEAAHLLERDVGRIGRRRGAAARLEHRAATRIADADREDRIVRRPAGGRNGEQRPPGDDVADHRRVDRIGARTNSVGRDRCTVLRVLHRIRDRDRRFIGERVEDDRVVPVGLVDGAPRGWRSCR